MDSPEEFSITFQRTVGDAALELGNTILSTGMMHDSRVRKFSGDQLAIVAGFDISYGHELELYFSDVRFIYLPVDFHADYLRRDKDREVEPSLREHMDDHVGIYTLGAKDEENSYFIIAGELEAVSGRVYYYDREDLKPGERIELPGK